MTTTGKKGRKRIRRYATGSKSGKARGGRGFAEGNFPKLSEQTRGVARHEKPLLFYVCPSKKGFAFSLDLAASVIVMILMLSLMVAAFGAAKEGEIARVKKMSLEGKAVFLLDAMAKNRNEEQPLLGSALYDKERHRVLANEIDARLLENARQLGSADFFVKSVSLKGLEEKTILFGGEGRQCVSLDRVVLAGKSRALLGVVLCEK